MTSPQRPDGHVPAAADPNRPQQPEAVPTRPQPSQPPQAPQAGPQEREAPKAPVKGPEEKARRTRLSGLWVASIGFAVVLLVLLVFILQNGSRVQISFFGAHGHLALGVALLLSAVLGMLLVIIPGAARIIQLRLTNRRHH